MNSTKRCLKCGEDKPESDWQPALWLTAKNGWCRSCYNAWQRERYRNNPSIRQKNARNHWKTQYGLSEEQITSLWEQSGGRCEVCGGREDGRSGRGVSVLGIHIDHDPDDRRIRGLLCSSCNLGIARFKNQPRLLRAAATYLEDYEAGKRGVLPENGNAPLLGHWPLRTWSMSRR